jgi:hypothetical protein
MVQMSPWTFKMFRLPARSCKPSTFCVIKVKLFRALFKFGQRKMPRIGLRLGDYASAPVIPFPNQFRIALECFWGGEVFRPEIAPESAGSTKGRDAALGGNSRAGEDGDRSSGGDPLAGAVHSLLIMAADGRG